MGASDGIFSPCSELLLQLCLHSYPVAPSTLAWIQFLPLSYHLIMLIRSLHPWLEWHLTQMFELLRCVFGMLSCRDVLFHTLENFRLLRADFILFTAKVFRGKWLFFAACLAIEPGTFVKLLVHKVEGFLGFVWEATFLLGLRREYLLSTDTLICRLTHNRAVTLLLLVYLIFLRRFQ